MVFLQQTAHVGVWAAWQPSQQHCHLQPCGRTCLAQDGWLAGDSSLQLSSLFFFTAAFIYKSDSDVRVGYPNFRCACKWHALHSCRIKGLLHNI